MNKPVIDLSADTAVCASRFELSNIRLNQRTTRSPNILDNLKLHCITVVWPRLFIHNGTHTMDKQWHYGSSMEEDGSSVTFFLSFPSNYFAFSSVCWKVTVQDAAAFQSLRTSYEKNSI